MRLERKIKEKGLTFGCWLENKGKVRDNNREREKLSLKEAAEGTLKGKGSSKP